MMKPRILVVEDYADVRVLLGAVLSEVGAVVTAEKKALDMVLRKQHFDI